MPCRQSRNKGTVAVILSLGASRGVGGQCHTLADLPPEMSPDAHCAGGWVGPSVGLDKC